MDDERKKGFKEGQEYEQLLDSLEHLILQVTKRPDKEEYRKSLESNFKRYVVLCHEYNLVGREFYEFERKYNEVMPNPESSQEDSDLPF